MPGGAKSPSRSLFESHTHKHTPLSILGGETPNDENETVMRIYESVGCVRLEDDRLRVLGPPRAAPPPPVAAHLDFHSCKLRLITGAYARPGAVNMLRSRRHPPTCPPAQVEAGGAGMLCCITLSPVRSVMQLHFFGPRDLQNEASAFSRGGDFNTNCICGH